MSIISGNTISSIISMPKADLHLHLNGLFDSDIVRQILTDENITLPSNFNLLNDCVVTRKVDSLVKYFKPWEALHLIPNQIQDFRKLVSSAFEYLASENIRYVELRSSAIYLSGLLKLSLEDTLNLMIDVLDEFSHISFVDYNLIITIQRSYKAIYDLQRFLEAYCNIGKPKRIVALGLAGDEDFPVSKDLSAMFRKAKDEYGLNITIHAGETGNIKSIYEAIDLFSADRIGHGCIAVKDLNLIEKLSKNQICIEVCPTSNYLTNAYNGIPPHITFKKYEIPFVICSDNPGIHKKGLSDDYIRFLEEGGSFEILQNMFDEQMKYSFVKK